MSEQHPEAGPAQTPNPQEPGNVPHPTAAAGGVPVPHPEAGVPAGQSAVGAVAAPRPVSAAAGRRPPWWLVAVLLVVAVGAGFGAGALIWAGRVEQVYPPGYKALSPEQYDKCVREVRIYFDGEDPDPAMRAAADQLRDDERFESVHEETRQEAYERFKDIFADQPELLDQARPEALPASVTLLVRKGTTGKQVQGALRGEFPDADVTVQDYCPGPPQ